MTENEKQIGIAADHRGFGLKIMKKEKKYSTYMVITPTNLSFVEDQLTQS
jgi:hypothetical protein